MGRTKKIRCPMCGALMNHHADKLVTVTDGDSVAAFDPVLNGVIQQTHTCPVCANVEFRVQTPGGLSTA
jgi:ribosomal protein S27AE